MEFQKRSSSAKRWQLFLGLSALTVATMALFAFMGVCMNGKKQSNAALGQEAQPRFFSTIGKYKDKCEFPSLELQIREEKKNNRVEFFPAKYEHQCLEWHSKEQFEANCAFVYRYDPQIEPVYTIRTYDKNGRQVAAYEINSGRFIFWDKWGEDGKIVDGGCDEQAEGLVDVRLPYDNRVVLIRIRIEDNGTTRENMAIENAGEEMDLLRIEDK